MKVYDISGLEHEPFPGNKPYFGFKPKNDEQIRLLDELLHDDRMILAELENLEKFQQQKHSESGSNRFIRAIPVGETPEGQAIVNVTQGIISKNGDIASRWLFVVCDPDAIEEMRHDLDITAEKHLAHLDNISSGVDSTN
jgi:hypothetical protein